MNDPTNRTIAHLESFEGISGRLRTIRDMVRFGATAFHDAGLCFGHGTDNSLDEALALTLHALGLDYSLDREFLGAILSEPEMRRIYELFRRRIEERRPVAYLTHEALFAGLPFYVDERVVIPRSPFAELIRRRFEPWMVPERVGRILDLCCGSGCIGIACAHAFPHARVDLADRDPAALQVARRNVEEHRLEPRVEIVASDLFSNLAGRRYDLIVCNPPYVDAANYAALPPEYAYEPREGLESGPEGLDHALAILAGAAAHLTTADAVLFLEVGEARPALERRLPRLAVTWIALERGGEDIAAVSSADLDSPGALDLAA